jgi:hypothetical protein
MKQFFKNFRNVEYTLPSGTKFTATDLNLRFQIVSALKDKYLTTYTYKLDDHERPDTVAYDYYGNADYAWLVMISGGLFHYLDEWPLLEEQLTRYIEDTYNMPVTTAMTTVHHYVDSDGDTVSAVTSYPVTIYDYEFHKNEQKRYIRLISKEYLPAIVAEMEDFFKAVK